MKTKWAFLVCLYLFVLSIELIKETSFILSDKIHLIINSSLSPLKAVSAGWIITAIIQSGGATGGLVMPFVANNLLSVATAVFIMMGARIGGTGISLIIALPAGFKRKRRDFRHGFEIGLAYFLYSILLVIMVFIMEYFFGLFSRLGLFLAGLIGPNINITAIPNLIKYITHPLISIIYCIQSEFLVLMLAFLLLILTLKFFTKSIISFFGGEDKARKFINKYFKSRAKAFIIGFLFTALVFSTAVSITLLVPLAVSRLINLKKAIPFILGAAIGTSTDVLLASLITGNISAFGVAVAYVLFGIFGAAVFLPNTLFLFNITKFISKRIIHISERKATLFLIIFLLVPLLLILIL